ncbi:hypothetical protein GCM10027321_23840 [Massilia terrae]|uniref:Hemolysin XhlA n=1 Tax=Massilia terrae TaxID=1811224 RepID=A0ABT2CXI0_9BURK|nr:hypothetical protein [Massilia terrae]MCS0658692.1 hypothetical protein [Massilia terrae]
MDTETTRIEERLAALERDVAVIKSNYVTKEDLQRELNAQTWRFMTFVAALNSFLVGAIYFLAAHFR